MKRAVEEGQKSYAENVPKFEAWLAKMGQAGVAKAFGYDHLLLFPRTSRTSSLPERWFVRVRRL